MKNTNRYSACAQVTVCLLLAWPGCAASTNAPIEAPGGTTTAAVPTANGTYDRAKDPAASNAGVGTTEAHPRPSADGTTAAPVPAR
jgi:hypothetical protein